MGRRFTVMVLLRVGAFAACAQLVVAYPFVAAAQQPPAGRSAGRPRRTATGGSGRAGSAAQAPGRGRGPQPVDSRVQIRTHRFADTNEDIPVRALRVFEGEAGPEGAADRDAARSRRDAHDDDAAQRDRSRRSRRLHPAGADGLQPARVVRRAGAPGTARRSAHECSTQRRPAPKMRRAQSGGAQPDGGEPNGGTAGTTWRGSGWSHERPTIRRTCAS